MNISDFLNTDYNAAALYILYRNTASYIDGLKNVTRKVIYTVKKGNVTNPIKVTALASKTIENAEYLHGEGGCQGAIVTAAADYCGSNNLPVLKGVGSFGTRFSPAASAPRYIFAGPTDYSKLLFRKEDEINLISQEFEGKEIEPMFYVPTLPLILINGTEGIGVGFASTIFPRSVENIIKLTRATINKEKIQKKWLYPSWRGFRGSVEHIEGSWILKGLATIDNKRVLIDELPITWDLGSYRKHLKGLKEKGIIQRFNDFAEDEHFKFEVVLTDDELKKSEDLIWKDLGLVKSMTETLTCFDENNKIREYNGVEEIFNDYYKIKIKYLKLRIKSELTRLKKEESELEEMYKFIQEIIKGTIVLQKKKKSVVEDELKQKGYTIIDRLIGLPLYSITEDKAKEIEKRWKDKIVERKNMEQETPENYWLKDIQELEKVLIEKGYVKC